MPGGECSPKERLPRLGFLLDEEADRVFSSLDKPMDPYSFSLPVASSLPCEDRILLLQSLTTALGNRQKMLWGLIVHPGVLAWVSF